MMAARIQRETQLQKDPAAFIKILKEAAVYYQETSIYQGADSVTAQPNGGKRYKPSRPTTFKVRLDGAKTSESAKDSNESQKKGPLTCFNCNEIGHKHIACPKKKQSKQDINDDHKRSNKSKKASNYLFVCIGNDSSEVLVKINESLYFPAILDSGARGVSLIPRSIAIRAMNNDPSITLQRLHEPVRLRLGDNQSEIWSTDYVCVNLRLRTKAGGLMTRRRKCLIWDVPSDEIILGSDLLEELGVEPKNALDALILKKKSVSQKNDDTDERHTEESVDFVQILSNQNIHDGIKNMLKTAAENGLPQEWLQRLERLVKKYWNIWRSDLGPDPPAKVTPFVTRLLPNARPFRCKGRRYSPEESQFLKEFTDELIMNGFIEENLNSEWASPVLVVKKSNGGKRMVVDLRAVNALCESTAWPMPYLEAVVNNLAGAEC